MRFALSFAFICAIALAGCNSEKSPTATDNTPGTTLSASTYTVGIGGMT